MTDQLTDLDRQLQEIANTNWQKFVALVGEDALTSAKVCLLRKNGNTYGQIRFKLPDVTKSMIETRCKKCD
jgi:hypothetical protein